MINKKIKFVMIILIVILIPSILAIPQSLTLNGKLTDSSGSILSGDYNMTFRFYSSYTGGSSMLTIANQSVSVGSDGIYHALLQGINLTFVKPTYLGITVREDSEMSPRINLTSSPYSFRSNVTENLNASNNYELENLTVNGRVGVGTSNPTKELDVSGDSVFRGIFTIKDIFGIDSFRADHNTGDITIFNDLIVLGKSYLGSFEIQNELIVDSINISGASGKVGIGTLAPQYTFGVNGSSFFGGDIFQSTSLSLFYDILHTGRRENYAGNSGLGQGVPAKNKWLNRTEEIEYFPAGYGLYKFSGGAFDGENIWLAPSYSDFVVKLNPATGEMTNYSHGQGDYAFYGACYDGEGVWFAPFNANNFMKIYPNGTMVNVSNPYGSSGFSGCVFTGEETVFIPEEADYIAAIDPFDNSLRNVSTTNISSTYAAIAFNGGFWDGSYVWMSPYNSPYIVRVNVSDGTLANYEHPLGLNHAAYVGALFDGVYGWFLPANNQYFLRLNPSTGEMTEFPTGEAVGESFIGGCWDGINIWMAGEYADHILKFDPHSGEINSYVHGKGNEAFRGCIFDGSNVWFVPFQSDSLGRIRPPEFGRDSLFTSGNTNIGGNVTIDGGVTINGVSRIRAYRALDQTIGDSTPTKINLGSEDYDNLGEFDSATNYRFTCTQAGYYLINGQIQSASLGDGNSLRTYIYKNGVDITHASSHSSGNLAINANCMTIQYLAVNDYIELWVYQNSGGNADVTGGSDKTFLEVHRLS